MARARAVGAFPVPQPNLQVSFYYRLLTLGPQLRGSENTRIGQRATVQVFEMIKQAVRPYLKEATRKTLIVLFNLDALLGGRGDEARRFREMLCSSVGIPV
jgi:hypothetical protein